MNRLNIQIRTATPDDAIALARVHIDSWRAAYRGLVPDSHLAKLDYTLRAKRFRASLMQKAEETYIAEKGKEIVGFITLGACRDEDLNMQTTGEIWGIYLAPAHWRNGFGSALCTFGENLLKKRGYQLVTLWVFAGNPEARRFYEAMGFKADGTGKVLKPGKPLKAIRYRKKI